MTLWRFDALPPPGTATAGDWLPAAAGAFHDALAGGEPPYPCDFGARAQRLGHNRVTALDARDAGGLATLADALREFAELAAAGPPRQSLVVFCGPPRGSADLADDRRRFWSVLEGLSGLDKSDWPAEVPDDPVDPQWQWTFGGEPWFVFALSPAYVARRSRAITPCLTLIFQTGRVFTGLAGSTAAGRQAKRRIRAALAAYDAVPAHPHLGDAERSSSAKWRQYLLPDDQSVYRPDTCPFRSRL